MNRPDRPSFVLPVEPPGEPAVPRDSATVIVVRDGASGLEVFMLERHLRSDFAGGAYVFPGGTLDVGDSSPELAAHTDGWSSAAAREMGEADEDRARALVLCAIRETFEEAGILLAHDGQGRPVRLDPAEADRWRAYRRALQAGEVDPAEGARRAGVRFAADALRFWARWITPTMSPRRYDTRFFVAVMPEGQVPLHDDIETTASAWVRPDDAVRRALAGEFSIIFPTRKILESLAEFSTAQEVFDAAVGRPAEPVLPLVVIENGEGRILMPDGTSHAP
ncbi:MAG: NUDIX hydrolase [Actinomycetota bacterium]